MRGLKELLPFIVAVGIATVILLSWIWSGARFVTRSRSAVPHAMPVPAGGAVSGVSPPIAGAPVASAPGISSSTVRFHIPSTPDARLRLLTLALRMYTEDYHRVLPPFNNSTRLETLLSPYLAPYQGYPNLFVDPINRTRFGVNPSLSGKSLSTIPNPANIIVFYQQAPDPRTGKRWVAFLDGHVKAIDNQQWQKLSKASGIKPTSAPRTKPKRL